MFSNLFNYDNPFWRFMGKLWDLILLNILWIICSIPVFTIGATSTAVYYVTLKLVKDEEGATIPSFFRSFRDNFKQATVLWLMLLVVVFVLVFDWRFALVAGGSAFAQIGMRAVFGCLSFVVLATVVYLFPLQARFYNPVKRTIINACLMAIRHFPKTIAMLVTDVGLVAVCVFVFPQAAIILFLFGFPLFAFLNSYVLVTIFEKYMPKEGESPEGEGIARESGGLDGSGADG
ncbi:MAG: YesL family protein [Lachnospiraceae bacterium]|jgi:uncharacterized membrane protein YesL|nr:YesL family protein [Lachnospiraceae bacterium]